MRGLADSLNVDSLGLFLAVGDCRRRGPILIQCEDMIDVVIDVVAAAATENPEMPLTGTERAAGARTGQTGSVSILQTSQGKILSHR